MTAVQSYFSAQNDEEKRKCNILDELQLSPLHYAASTNRLDVIRLLIDHGAGKLFFILILKWN